ncbi:hypothetical protein VULLAG_LOCUS6877 [Vulpes lagopus]
MWSTGRVTPGYTQAQLQSLSYQKDTVSRNQGFVGRREHERVELRSCGFRGMCVWSSSLFCVSTLRTRLDYTEVYSPYKVCGSTPPTSNQPKDSSNGI